MSLASVCVEEGNVFDPCPLTSSLCLWQRNYPQLKIKSYMRVLTISGVDHQWSGDRENPRSLTKVSNVFFLLGKGFLKCFLRRGLLKFFFSEEAFFPVGHFDFFPLSYRINVCRAFEIFFFFFDMENGLGHFVPGEGPLKFFLCFLLPDN